MTSVVLKRKSETKKQNHSKDSKSAQALTQHRRFSVSHSHWLETAIDSWTLSSQSPLPLWLKAAITTIFSRWYSYIYPKFLFGLKHSRLFSSETPVSENRTSLIFFLLLFLLSANSSSILQKLYDEISALLTARLLTNHWLTCPVPQCSRDSLATNSTSSQSPRLVSNLLQGQLMSMERLLKLRSGILVSWQPVFVSPAMRQDLYLFLFFLIITCLISAGQERYRAITSASVQLSTISLHCA